MAEIAEQPAPITAPLYALLPPAVKQILLFVGVAAAVAVGVAMALWSQGENYTPLYSGLADRDVGEITAQLDSANIPYKLDSGSGALLVPADRKYQVRMQLASSGLPHGAGFGIEEMPEQSSFGQTPFMENALYVRAVETELARTIGSMQPVEMARVHLALPPQSVFLRQKREPSASVMLKLFSGRRLDDSQVQAVVHLVASSVPDLTPSRVTVVDQSGALLTSSERRLHRRAIELAVRLSEADRAGVRAAYPEPGRLHRRPGTSARQRGRRGRLYANGADARELRSKRADGPQRADQRGHAPRRWRPGRARRAQQSAARRGDAAGRNGHRNDGAARELVALAGSQLRARQDREPHAAGRRRDSPAVDRRARRQQAARAGARRVDTADGAGDRVR